MTGTQRADALQDPWTEAARCRDLATACLEFDRARARMRGWREAFRVLHWQMLGGRGFPANLATRAIERRRQWVQAGIVYEHYRAARLAARVWRRQVRHLDAQNNNTFDEYKK